ncbi:TetR/AcrR family transcriptional regulator [Lacisediminihabitans sp. FW035]
MKVQETPRGAASIRKRGAILAAAEDVFLRNGYLGASMDEVSALSGVSKQTVYSHFGSKQALFIELVSAMTTDVGDRVIGELEIPAEEDELAGFLRAYARRQLSLVTTPRILQLRRLVIGEVARFPELAETLYITGPQRAITAIAAMLEQLHDRGLLSVDDPAVAASQFNWLMMGEPLNRAMLLGDAGVPTSTELDAHAAAAVRVFLAAFAVRR